MRDPLRLLLTGTAVSAVAIVAAVWVNSPEEFRLEERLVPSTLDGAAPNPAAGSDHPVKDGVWPSAVVSEDMRRALDERADAQPAATGIRAPGDDAGPETPREIGEFLDPEAPLAASSAQEPRSIGELLDPEAVAFEPATAARVSLGRFLDPDRPQPAAPATGRPVMIGRPVDPDGGTAMPPAAQPNRIEIGEYIEVVEP